MQQDERVDVGELLGGQRLPDCERPHLMRGSIDDLRNGSELHTGMTTIEGVKLRDILAVPDELA
jgi:hypothetical protein